MIDRIELLKSLLRFDRPLGQIVEPLNKLSWDNDNVLVILETQHLANVLRRYLSGVLSASEVEDWANAIECREDIGYERDIEEILSEVIFAVANPMLTRPLSHHDAQKWIEQLERSTPVTAS